MIWARPSNTLPRTFLPFFFPHHATYPLFFHPRTVYFQFRCVCVGPEMHSPPDRNPPTHTHVPLWMPLSVTHTLLPSNNRTQTTRDRYQLATLHTTLSTTRHARSRARKKTPPSPQYESPPKEWGGLAFSLLADAPARETSKPTTPLLHLATSKSSTPCKSARGGCRPTHARRAGSFARACDVRRAALRTGRHVGMAGDDVISAADGRSLPGTRMRSRVRGDRRRVASTVHGKRGPRLAATSPGSAGHQARSLAFAPGTVP